MTVAILDKLNTINLHELPIGKHRFIATVQGIRNIHEIDYYCNQVFVPYVYFNNIQILINGNWFHVECSGNSVKSKIGKKLEKLNLEKEDTISFDAHVLEKAIAFSNIEGQDTDDEPDDLESNFFDDFEPLAILPKNYKGIITVDVYETAFSIDRRLWKNNYKVHFDRQTFNKELKTIDYKRKATPKNDGYFREAQGMYFKGKEIKNLSKIRRFKMKENKNAEI